MRETALPIWWEQVMELGEKDGDEGPFLGRDNLREGVTNMGQKNGVNRSDPSEYYARFPDPGCCHPPTFTLEHDLGG